MMFDDFKTVSLRETDEELRQRIRYVAGSSRELEHAQHEDLDAIAERYNLRRRVNGR